MAQVSREAIDQLTKNLDALTVSAKNTLAKELKKVDTNDYQQVAGVMRRVCEPYMGMSAAVTAEFYNDLRKAAKAKGTYSAAAESGYDAEAVTSASYSIQKEVIDGRNTMPFEALLGDVLDREINNASRECVVRNCRRDPVKPKYASVPTSPTPCEWCIMRASAGFVYDADSGSHNNCKCRLIPGFEGVTKIEGYNQSEYEDEWNEAAHAYRHNEISEDLQEEIRAAKKKHEEDFEAGRVTKEWDSTNAILMVMRRQKS